MPSLHKNALLFLGFFSITNEPLQAVRGFSLENALSIARRSFRGSANIPKNPTLIRRFSVPCEEKDPKKLKIMLLSSAFNGLTQRTHRELKERGHEITVELAVDDARMKHAVTNYNPDLILAPMLKKAIPKDVYDKFKCFILHPGIVGDRGPSSLDWATLHGEPQWGVTVLQADKEMDAGDIWATSQFPLSFKRKSSTYNQEVTEAGVESLLEAVHNYQQTHFSPRPYE